jgi:hypothetical protein
MAISLQSSSSRTSTFAGLRAVTGFLAGGIGADVGAALGAGAAARSCPGLVAVTGVVTPRKSDAGVGSGTITGGTVSAIRRLVASVLGAGAEVAVRDGLGADVSVVPETGFSVGVMRTVFPCTDSGAGGGADVFGGVDVGVGVGVGGRAVDSGI